MTGVTKFKLRCHNIFSIGWESASVVEGVVDAAAEEATSVFVEEMFHKAIHVIVHNGNIPRLCS